MGNVPSGYSCVSCNEYISASSSDMVITLKGETIFGVKGILSVDLFTFSKKWQISCKAEVSKQ